MVNYCQTSQVVFMSLCDKVTFSYVVVLLIIAVFKADIDEADPVGRAREREASTSGSITETATAKEKDMERDTQMK